VSNQVRDLTKIDRLARLPRYGARIVVCVDDLANVAELSAAAEKHRTSSNALWRSTAARARCGRKHGAEVVAIARAIDAAPGLKFTGIQAYQGAMQHLERYEDRKSQARCRDRSG